MTESRPAASVPVTPPEPRGARVRTVALVLVAIGVVFAGLYFGRGVFVPVGMAFVFTALLRPVVRWLEKVHVPTTLAAALVVIAALALVAGAGTAVVAPVQSWVRSAPQSVRKARERLTKLTRSVQPVAGALGSSGAAEGPGASGGKGAPAPSSSAAKPAGGSGDPAPGSSSGGGGSPGGGSSPNPAVPSVAGKLFGATTSFIGSFVEVLLLTWFLLASGRLFPRKLLNVLPLPWEKRAALDVLRQTESVISGYLFVSLLINIGQGAVVGLVMWWLGMPTPVVWAMLTVVLEFIPYLGAAVMMALLALVGLATFASTLHALLPPGAYLVITTLQNNLVSPISYGRRLKLNPVAVLVAVMVWFELWGIPGAFLAVPIIASLKVLGDRLDGLHAMGEFLGE